VIAAPQPILCDGCGVVASPEHIRERLARLEVATRFRPIHIGVLFVAPAPDASGDFYDASPRKPGPREVLLDALDIAAVPAANGDPTTNAIESRLAEFQRRGYFFASVSDCPLPTGDDAAQAVEHLASTMLKRIQFSYKPKSVVLLSESLAPLVTLLAAAGQGIRVLPDGAPLSWPASGDAAPDGAFRSACARIAEASRT
jgi:hypothetical protein